MVKNTFIHFNGETQEDFSQNYGMGSMRREHSEPPRKAGSGSNSFRGTDSEEDLNDGSFAVCGGNRQMSDSAALCRPYQTQGQFLLFSGQQNSPSGQTSGNAPVKQQSDGPSSNPPQMESQLLQLQMQQQLMKQQHQQQVQALQQQHQMEMMQLQLQMQNNTMFANNVPAPSNSTDDDDYVGQYQPSQNQPGQQFMAPSSGSSPAALAQAWMSQMNPPSQNSQLVDQGHSRPKFKGRSQDLMKASADTGSTPEPGLRLSGDWPKGESRRDQDAGSGALMENSGARNDTDPNNGAEGSVQSRRRAIDPHAWENGVVTVMVRQLPRQYTQRMFLQEIVRRGFEGLFDFIYLPYDFKNGNNVGYGFINFTEPEHAIRFRDSLDGHYLDKFMKTKGKAVRVHPAQVQGYEANYRHFAHTKTGQKQDPSFSPLFFPVPKDAQVLELLKQLNDQDGEMRGSSASTTTQNQAPSKSVNLDGPGDGFRAQDTQGGDIRQRLAELQEMERQLIERNPMLRRPASALQGATMQNPTFGHGSDMRKSLREAHEQKPRTKRGGRQQQQQLPSQHLQGMPLLPAGMHEVHEGAQQTQHMQHMQQMQQQLLAYSPDLIASIAPAWYPTSQNQDQATLAPQPGLTFGWMPADLSK